MIWAICKNKLSMDPLILKKYYREQICNIPNYYHQEVARIIKPGDVVLDAGCGSGEFGVLKKYGDKASKIVGLDLNGEALDKNEIIDEKLVGNLEEIPCEDNIFDLIVCETVCEHLEHPEKVFSEFSRVLKKGGHVILRTYNIYSLRSLISFALPLQIRKRMKGKLLSEDSEGTFPTFYRCNSRRRLRKQFRDVGMSEENFIASRDWIGYWNRRGIMTAFVLYEKITDTAFLRFTKLNIVGVYFKV